MINALVKKFASDDGAIDPAMHHQNSAKSARRKDPPYKASSFPTGVNPVGAELQRKFAGGIDYNMKILIRGDRNTGKTALWKRLQGFPFVQEEGDTYTQTEEIQVASITWNYRARDFVVKLDVWDVVDKGRRAATVHGSTTQNALKFGGNNRKGAAAQMAEMPSAIQEVLENAACDASTVNVYNGCSGVIFSFDVTREWTWAYVRRELPNVPSHVPVLILANKMDLVDPALPTPTTIEDCLHFLSVFNERSRVPNSSDDISQDVPVPVRFAKASMKRAQGLKYLYNFFNIPFLLLQKNFLARALDANSRELQIAENELNILAKEEGQNPTMWRRQKSAESKEGRRKRSGRSEEDDEEEEDDEGDGSEEDEDVWKEKEEEESPKAAEEGKKNGLMTMSRIEKTDQNKSSKRELGLESDRRRQSSSSSSDGANPHVSTYAEDVDDAEDYGIH